MATPKRRTRCTDSAGYAGAVLCYVCTAFGVCYVCTVYSSRDNLNSWDPICSQRDFENPCHPNRASSTEFRSPFSFGIREPARTEMPPILPGVPPSWAVYHPIQAPAVAVMTGGHPGGAGTEGPRKRCKKCIKTCLRAGSEGRSNGGGTARM